MMALLTTLLCRGVLKAAAFGLVVLASAPVAGAQGTAQPDSNVTVFDTTRLIRKARPTAVDPQGWALDMHDVLLRLKMPVIKENVCAAIAVIDQESNFRVNPEVPNLGALSETALREKFGRIPIAGRLALAWLERKPTPDTSFMTRIREAKTERDLDLAYRSLVTYAGETSNLDMVMQLGLLNKIIEEKNDIDTVGSMQVSVKFALEEARKKRWLPMTLADVYAVRDELYTRRGGMYYGILQLMGYHTGYSAKVHRFADYNAGRYASRNAAFQQALVQLTGSKLALDGDLLSYDKNGVAKPAVTATEQTLREASRRFDLGLDDKQIRADLLHEKQPDFPATRSFLAVREKLQAKTGKPVAFAIVPSIQLNSPKLSKGFTTRRFAENVDKRYRGCMATQTRLKM